jgi:alpha-galactosidase
LPALQAERLEIVKALLPPIGKRAQVLDWLDSRTPSRIKLSLSGAIDTWTLLAMLNWEDHPISLSFTPEGFQLAPDQTYWLREFWTGEISQMSSDSPFTARDVPAHGVRVLAICPYNPEQPAYLGSDIHFSQGMEIGEWSVKEGEITIEIGLDRKITGTLYLYLPWKPKVVLVNDQSNTMQEMGDGIYQLRVENTVVGNIIVKG